MSRPWALAVALGAVLATAGCGVGDTALDAPTHERLLTRSDAIATAASWVVSGQRVIDGGDAAIASLVAERASRGGADVLASELRTERAALVSAVGGTAGLRWRQGVVAVRVMELEAGTASVDVWHVGVLAGPTVSPQTQWATTIVDLVAEDGRWKVRATRRVPGPTPVADGGAAPVTAGQLEAALTGFEPVVR